MLKYDTMLTIDPKRSLLLVVDFQSRLMPAIHEGETAVRNAKRLVEAAKLFGIERLFTEQNAKGLGAIRPRALPRWCELFVPAAQSPPTSGI